MSGHAGPPAAGASGQPVTITIARSVRPGRESDFEALVRAFIPRSLVQPGSLGVHVVKPAPGSRDYYVVLKFATRELWERFLEWPEYVAFRTALDPLLERSLDVAELSGLESWFTVPGHPQAQPPPKWKMAFVTWIGVCVTVYVVSTVLAEPTAEWLWWPRFLLVNALVVVGLAWAVLPVLTKVLRPWLHPGSK